MRGTTGLPAPDIGTFCLFLEVTIFGHGQTHRRTDWPTETQNHSVTRLTAVPTADSNRGWQKSIHVVYSLPWFGMQMDGMTNYRIGPHRNWTEHLDLEIARIVGRIGSGLMSTGQSQILKIARVVSQLGRKVCLYQQNVDMNESVLVLCGHFEVQVFRSDVLQCGK